MRCKYSNGTFLTVAATVGATLTLESQLVSGADFTSLIIDVTSAEKILIAVETVGANAGIDADISADLVIALDDTPTLWTTANVLSQVFETVTCHAQTNAAERAAETVDVESVSFIGIGRLRNADAVVNCDVQVYWSKYEEIS